MMPEYLFEFRELFHQLHNVEAHQAATLLAQWAGSNRDILKPYRKFQKLDALDNSYPVESEDLWSFYTLSRICNLMLLPFQTGEHWFDLTRPEFENFWQTLGIAAREPRDYHPFWCEIVACENVANENAAPRIEEVFWPALTWGDLLICRAGVRVSAGRNWLNADLAPSSKLYFAHRRAYRPVEDLSHGWGSNSQWRTDFRRDYVWGEHLVFNADGAPDLNEPPFLQNLSASQWAELKPPHFFASDFHRWEPGEIGSTAAERESLLVNRCLIGGEVTEAEFWPYDDAAIWRRDAPLQPV